ncbi:MAG: DUF1501 domain-containing protein [Acidimicrobiia bacterium]|nr:DUF1501 domain-containing protein [Acidimicrobiia bacterium]
MSPVARISRRQFMTGAAGAAAAGAVGLTVARHPWSAAAKSSAPSLSGKGTLVLVTLYGGNDGLNTVIPYQDPAYLQARATLGYQPNEVLPLGDGLALAPALKGMKSLWDQKQLAIVRGVGYPDPNRSHFRSMDIWQTGVPDHAVGTGWLGRWLDATGTDPLRTLSIGPTLPRLLAGDKTSGSSVPSGSVALGTANAKLLSAFDALANPSPGEAPWAARIAQTGADFLTVQHTVADALAHQPDQPGATGSNLEGASQTGAAGKAGGALGTQLDLVARLIKAGIPTRVYSVSLGGFDTHAAEKDTQARLLGELDAAVSSFFTSLHGTPHADQVVLMTYSEFGRRVAANASAGTDHGTAAPVFVVGPPVKGGFYGDEPPLTNLDDGDLRFTTDYRSVYTTLLNHVLGVDATVTLDRKYPPLALPWATAPHQGPAGTLNRAQSGASHPMARTAASQMWPIVKGAALATRRTRRLRGSSWGLSRRHTLSGHSASQSVSSARSAQSDGAAPWAPS